MAQVLAAIRVAWRYPAKTRRLSNARVRRMAAKTANPTIIVTEFRPALISVRWPAPTVRVWPVATSRKVSGWCPAMACISRYQAGTKATRSRAASRLRAWLRSENRHAVGNCPNAATCGGAGGRRVRSVADIGTLRSGGTNGEAAIGEIGQHV